MATDATKVLVGAGGKIYRAPLGTTLPTDATTALDVAFVELGHITEDGVTESNDKSTSNIKNWYGAVVRESTTEQNYKLGFAMMQTDANTLETYYGDTTATDTAWKVAAVQGIRESWIIDAVDGDKTRRLVVPDGQVTDAGDITSATEDAITYPVTVTTYPDGSNVNYYGYIDDGS